jgi:outer membrane protein assembly factor BamB
VALSQLHPVFEDDAVCIQAEGLAALDSASGTVLWRAALGGSLQSAPVLTPESIYLATLDEMVYALE